MADRTPKKMNVVQLTFIVTINMMGSGIIMLPTNMAKVGAISLLSWVVTALGSMAMAWGFAQAGIYNQRPGGLAAYAEDAYGKDGYFQTFFLYFLSLAIANVAVAVSALGYLAGFFPGLTATPTATCVGVIALLWLTTVANFGGPKITGQIGAVTVWGVILPVGFMAFFGWFWFKGSTFAEAWNPNGLSIMQGMGSSISLTLWAFLGLESASQNASAVENPKRDVPIACLFGTLGAGVIYVLSTTAIQGVVPNADLAASTGSFGTAFAQMFNPTIGSIVMGLAAMACVGSLLGWQFTLASVAKDAADTRMFPSVFGKATSSGAPITGMIIMGIVQTLLALMTVSPDLSSQFGALVNLAVVTNVVPYILALSALTVILQTAGVGGGAYTRTIAITVVGHRLQRVRAVRGRHQRGHGRHARDGTRLAHLAVHSAAVRRNANRYRNCSRRRDASRRLIGERHDEIHFERTSLGALDCVRDRIRRCVRDGGTRDRRPRSRGIKRETRRRGPRHGDGCDGCTAANDHTRAHQSGGQDRARLSRRRRADVVSRFLGTTRRLRGRAVQSRGRCDEERFGASSLAVEWVAVGSGFADVQDHRVDMICAADEVTQANREKVSFSIPIFPGGVSALVRANAPKAFQHALEERPQALRAVVARLAAADARASHVLGAGRFGDDGRAEGEHRRATADRERATRRGLRRRRSPRCASANRTCCSAIARNCCKPCSAARMRKTYGC